MSVTLSKNQDIYNKSPNIWGVSVDKNTIFTNDDVIDTFLKGKEVGVKEKKQVFVDNFNENIQKSANFTESMLAFFKKNNVKPIYTHLKVNAFDDLIILVTLPKHQFISLTP